MRNYNYTNPVQRPSLLAKDAVIRSPPLQGLPVPVGWVLRTRHLLHWQAVKAGASLGLRCANRPIALVWMPVNRGTNGSLPTGGRKSSGRLACSWACVRPGIAVGAAPVDLCLASTVRREYRAGSPSWCLSLSFQRPDRSMARRGRLAVLALLLGLAAAARELKQGIGKPSDVGPGDLPRWTEHPRAEREVSRTCSCFVGALQRSLTPCMSRSEPKPHPAGCRSLLGPRRRRRRRVWCQRSRRMSCSRWCSLQLAAPRADNLTP